MCVGSTKSYGHRTICSLSRRGSCGDDGDGGGRAVRTSAKYDIRMNGVRKDLFLSDAVRLSRHVV